MRLFLSFLPSISLAHRNQMMRSASLPTVCVCRDHVAKQGLQKGCVETNRCDLKHFLMLDMEVTLTAFKLLLADNQTDCFETLLAVNLP